MQRLLILISIIWLTLQTSAGATELVLLQGEVRVPIAGRTVTAGYLTVQNQTESEQELIAAKSPAFARIELHTHIEQDGMLRMVEVESIELEPGATLKMAPGGLHLMLFEPQYPLKAGEFIPLTLVFKNGVLVELELELTALPKR